MTPRGTPAGTGAPLTRAQERASRRVLPILRRHQDGAPFRPASVTDAWAMPAMVSDGLLKDVGAGGPFVVTDAGRAALSARPSTAAGRAEGADAQPRRAETGEPT